MRKFLYTFLGLTLAVSTVQASLYATTMGKCEVDYIVKDGLWKLGTFDQTALERATTLQKCQLVSASAEFINKRVLKFSFGNRTIPVANGLINPQLN